MKGTEYALCPYCDHLTLGQRDALGHVYLQPHNCPGGNK